MKTKTYLILTKLALFPFAFVTLLNLIVSFDYWTDVKIIDIERIVNHQFVFIMSIIGYFSLAFIIPIMLIFLKYTKDIDNLKNVKKKYEEERNKMIEVKKKYIKLIEEIKYNDKDNKLY